MDCGRLVCSPPVCNGSRQKYGPPPEPGSVNVKVTPSHAQPTKTPIACIACLVNMGLEMSFNVRAPAGDGE